MRAMAGAQRFVKAFEINDEMGYPSYGNKRGGCPFLVSQFSKGVMCTGRLLVVYPANIHGRGFGMFTACYGNSRNVLDVILIWPQSLLLLFCIRNRPGVWCRLQTSIGIVDFTWRTIDHRAFCPSRHQVDIPHLCNMNIQATSGRTDYDRNRRYYTTLGLGNDGISPLYLPEQNLKRLHSGQHSKRPSMNITERQS